MQRKSNLVILCIQQPWSFQPCSTLKLLINFSFHHQCQWSCWSLHLSVCWCNYSFRLRPSLSLPYNTGLDGYARSRIKSSTMVFILFIYVFSWAFITQDWAMGPMCGGKAPMSYIPNLVCLHLRAGLRSG